MFSIFFHLHVYYDQDIKYVLIHMYSIKFCVIWVALEVLLTSKQVFENFQMLFTCCYGQVTKVIMVSSGWNSAYFEYPTYIEYKLCTNDFVLVFKLFGGSNFFVENDDHFQNWTPFPTHWKLYFHRGGLESKQLPN